MSHNGAEIITQDPRMLELIALAEKMAPAATSVLITGPTGSGKELFARHIHRHSGRTGPFLAINCGSIAPTLLEARIFGHEAGVFTDGRKARPGCFEMAHGGTLFLDEVCSMKPDMQVSLLRVIEQKQVRRIGGSHDRSVDVKVVAAANRDLREAVRTGEFREDLYYRLNLLAIEIPPLSQRRGDIPLLVQHFAALAAEAHAVPRPTVTRDAMSALELHDWPGNIRDLKGVVEKLALFARDHRIDGRAVIHVLGTSEGVDVVPFKEFRARWAVRGLMKAGWRVEEMARRCGVHRSTVTRWLESMDVQGLRDEYVPESWGTLVDVPWLYIAEVLHQVAGSIPRAATLLEVDSATLSKWLSERSTEEGQCDTMTDLSEPGLGAMRHSVAYFGLDPAGMQQ